MAFDRREKSFAMSHVVMQICVKMTRKNTIGIRCYE